MGALTLEFVWLSTGSCISFCLSMRVTNRWAMLRMPKNGMPNNSWHSLSERNYLTSIAADFGAINSA
jgi:hypothetical protein